MLLGQLAEALGRRAGDLLGEIEFVHRFVLAEVFTVVQLLQQYQPRAGFRRIGDAGLDHRQVRFGIAVVGFLDQGDGQGLGVHGQIVEGLG